MEKIGNGELPKVPSLMKKQAKRYQSLAAKIYDLCRTMVSGWLYRILNDSFDHGLVVIISR